MEIKQRQLIRGGVVISPASTKQADVLLQGEQIVDVGPHLDAEGATVIDARGLLVLPGLIDIHVHLRDPGANHKEDFGSGTASALAGGFTTVVDMPNTDPPTSSLAALREKVATARSKAHCDYACWFGATPTNVDEAAAAGADPTLPVAGLKLYMGSSTGNLLVDDLEDTYRHFATFPAYRPLVVHAEDERVMRLFAAAPGGSHNRRRPPLAAALAVTRALHLAAHTGRRLHIAHLSTGAELDEVTLARTRGVQATCEVAPHHLFLSEREEERWGGRGKVNPPLRSDEDVQALWRGLDRVDLIATDHAPHTLEEKARAGEAAPSGLPGLETSLALMYRGVLAGRLTLNRLVELMSARPADLLGFGAKGRIAPGADADLVLFDPQRSWTLRAGELMTRAQWTPWDGETFVGRIEMVLLRGNLAYSHHGVQVAAGTGQEVLHGVSLLTTARPQ